MDSSEKKKIIMIIIACVILFTAAGSAVGLLILQKKQMDDMAQKHEKMMEELERMQENQEPGIREDTPDGNDEAAETEAAETNPIEIEPEGTKAAETKAAETGPAFLESLSGLSPGTVLSEEELDFDNLDQYFMVWEIEEGDNLYERINGKSYKKNDYVPLESLRYLKMPHYNFDGQIQVGEMIVSQDILEDVFAIFKELFQHKYQIQSMYLVDNYWTGDPDTTDSASIDVNNTSAFCFRMATGSGHLSNHA